MKVKVEKTEEGELFFRLPDEYQEELNWQDGDLIQWDETGDGSITLKRMSELELLKEKSLKNPDVKAEYDRICYGVTKLTKAGFDERQAFAIVSIMEEMSHNKKAE